MTLITDPLYDKKANFVGWLVEYENVFDKNLNWVAYIFNNFIWAKETGLWIGELRGTNLLDRRGKIVAWSTSGPVVGGIGFDEGPINFGPPIQPVKPLTNKPPVHPDEAPEPSGEWSELTFEEWLNQR